ncbi:ribonuclease E activity regulator RraA [Paludibacterium paludis]|uniref:4-hydroxy-4-methyl-2-oxoglutarate aldolase n=1 Tax=Paludibacterium paludis TaxID=1225769 RepID=A0A918U7V4_9NEIS|nr:ribonuclease E activity regulator RraA [Paludibacterium paludis]GGY06270.1 putative 4-hydroxy-4-methyl-2-oxoglutarate aldolase [Paludibacterium paludis]
MTEFMTSDLCDAFSEKLGIASPVFLRFGGRPRFCGEIATLKLFEDNSLVRERLSEAGRGRVLVVDGGGSLRCALLGDQLGELGVKNGWAGVVINGCIRDSVALAALPLGVRALATHPLKSVKRGGGESDVQVVFAGVRFVPGHWLYADEDGIVTSESPLL